MLQWFDQLLDYNKYVIAIAGLLAIFLAIAKFRIEWRKHILDKPIIEVLANRYPSGVVTDYRSSDKATKFSGDCIILRIKNNGRQPFYIENVGIFNDEEVFHTLPEVGESFSLSHVDKPREFVFPVNGITRGFLMMTDNRNRKSFVVRGCINHLKENQKCSKRKFRITVSEKK